MTVNYNSKQIDDYLDTAFSSININKSSANNNDSKTIDEYNLLIFTDGAYSRKQHKAGLGIYILCLNENNEYYKYNDTKIIKKLDDNLFIYNKNSYELTYYTPLINNNNNYKCENNCNYVALYNNKNEKYGKYCDKHKLENMEQVVSYIKYKPTNIRAEGLAILYTLIYIKSIMIDTVGKLKKNILKNLKLDNICHIKNDIKVCDLKKKCNNTFLIITDSEFWINVITKWHNNWINKDILLEKKNIDIIIYINYYLNILIDNDIMVEFKFIRSHSDDKIEKDKLTIEQKGNILADKLASVAQDNSNYDIKLI